MAHKTRGHQDLNTLRVVIGASKQLPQTDLPSLRDILAAGLYIKETSITHAKKINIFDLSVTLADQVISVYSKASFEFQPGKNMLPIKSIRKKIERDWLRQLTSGERGASCTMSPASWTIVSVKSFHVWRRDAVLSVKRWPMLTAAVPRRKEFPKLNSFF